MRISKHGLSLVIVIAILVAFTIGPTACLFRESEGSAADLMKGISANKLGGKAADDIFILSMSEFYFDLFKKTIDENENSLVSPLSVMLALAMTANGAANETLAQMEAVLGKDINIDDLNKYLLAYTKNLPVGNKYRISIANSIWFKDDEGLVVKPEFLQKNADYYQAQAYKTPFNYQTLKDINSWVNKNTEGMIDKMLDEIRGDAVIYLINAMVFKAEWENIYQRHKVHTGEFKGEDGKAYNVDFMSSDESVYLEDEFAVGFVKPYSGRKYSFVALLPNEDLTVGDYVSSLTGERFISMLQSASKEGVSALLPKFSCEYEVTMNETLKALGMPKAFSESEADFSSLGQSTGGNIFISEVLHKTFIKVDEMGTIAGAATEIVEEHGEMEMKTVRLDRPFVYAIVDNTTSLPIFIGTVMSF